MNSYVRLFRDLLRFLPGHTPTAWEETCELVPDRPIIILIPGFQATQRPVSVLRKRFLRDGYSVLVLSMDWLRLSDGVLGLYRMAVRLSGIILKIRKSANTKKCPIFLVGHSAGGLVARYYVQLLGGYHYCDGLVTLATPHQGSWFAALGFLSLLIVKARCLFQLLPVSPFIKHLNRAEYPKGFPMVSITSDGDPFCSAQLSHLAHGAQKEQVKDVVLNQVSHNGFLLSKAVYELTLAQLGVGRTAQEASNR